MTRSVQLGLLTLSLLITPAALAQGEADLKPGIYAKFETNHGTMIAELHYEKVPQTVANFVGLIEGTRPFERGAETITTPFYDGLTFHRIIKDFMIQGGCPEGTGRGGPGYRFEDEFDKSLRHDGAGILSMANSGKNTNGSQFFITLAATPHLNDRHSVFGKLVQGMDVLRVIGAVQTGPGDKPNEPVVMKKVTTIRVGEAAQAWKQEKVRAEKHMKDVPEPKGEADPKKTPAEGQGVQEQMRVEIICVQYKGCQRANNGVVYSKEEALEVAKKIVAHARLVDANFGSLARRWSDLPAHEYKLVNHPKQTDPSFAPAFSLLPGQVSDPTDTPYGIMIFSAK